MNKELKFDEIGYWSEIKLDIIKDYSKEYSKILNARKNPSFLHVYIDAFAGAGANISKLTREFVLGSPLNALLVNPPFCEYYLIDVDKQKVNTLSEIIGKRDNVYIFEGDCNKILIEKVFPRVKYEEYKRGLCVLDPYGLHLNWEVIQMAGKMKSIDIFINFPVMDMNRNALWRNYNKVPKQGIERMNMFWGDDSWKKIAYSTEEDLFGFPKKKDNISIVEAFRNRLRKVGGFKNVSEALPMFNTKGSVIYYLIFASQKIVALNINKHIFSKYKDYRK